MKDYKAENDNLKKLLKYWKKAYYEMDCYFDSISDEEQPKLAKRLEKIFKKIGEYETSNK
jgi:NAD-dependent DNA ligase